VISSISASNLITESAAMPLIHKPALKLNDLFNRYVYQISFGICVGIQWAAGACGGLLYMMTIPALSLFILGLFAWAER